MLVLTLLAGAAAFALVSLLGLYAPGVLATRSQVVLGLVAAAFGVLAVVMPGRPTGLFFVDATYRALLVGTIVIAARYARREWVLASTAVVLASTAHSPLV